MNKKELALILVFFFFGMALGVAFGGVIMASDDFSYQDSAIMTCDYANKITDVLNDQSETLKLYTNNDYTYLNQLNCSRLRS